MGRFWVLLMLTCCVIHGGDEQVDQVKQIEQVERQKRMVAEFGDYGKAPGGAAGFTETTWKGLRIELANSKNKRLTFECSFSAVRTAVEPHVASSGFPVEKFYHLIVEDGEIPVIAPRRLKDFNEVLEKLNKGAKVRLYGRIKEFRDVPKHKKLKFQKYFIELDSLTVLENEKQKGGNEKPPKKKKRKK